MRFITAKTHFGVGRTMWFVTDSTRRCVIVAEQISTVRTGLHVLVANALTTGVTGDDVGRTVWLFVDSTRGLISLAEYFVAGGTLCLILLTDLLAASTTGV